MNPPFDPGANNADLIDQLEELPERIEEAKLAWRRATLDSKKEAALAYLERKDEPIKRTVEEIKALVDISEVVYNARLNEAVKEAQYEGISEKLMVLKHISGLRRAF